MKYRVIRETNTWNRWGAKVNAIETVVLETDILEEAWRYHRTHDDIKAHGADNAVRHRVVDEAGQEVPLVDLYAAVIGPEEFRRQTHLPNFSINLDHWLANRIERDTALHIPEEDIVDQWIDHDEGVRVIQTPNGHHYEPIKKRRGA